MSRGKFFWARARLRVLYLANLNSVSPLEVCKKLFISAKKNHKKPQQSPSTSNNAFPGKKSSFRSVAKVLLHTAKSPAQIAATQHRPINSFGVGLGSKQVVKSK